jgi:hypothetical protein
MIMRWPFRMALLAGFGMASTAVAANGYCVACSGPSATYRCTIAGMPDGMPADPASQILCIKQLATSGGHERCSIERFSQENCNGPERIVAGGSVTTPLVTAPKIETPQPAGQPSAKSAAKTLEEGQPETGPVTGEEAAKDGTPDAGTQDPPRTVEELAKNSVSSAKENLDKAGDAVTGGAKKAGEQIEGAGSAIGNAAKKSWTCLASLFSDC